MEIEKGDIIYIFTDGYIDQFGGSESKKYRLAPFKELLMKITNKSMSEQKDILELEFNMWKGEFEQIDDVLVMGIKI
jgi:serine phosphatase RsbU (regulator of sigma subunit)